MRSKKTKSLYELTDQCFVVYGEKIPEKGEDSYLLHLELNTVFIGAFDGSGGSGSKIYPEFEGKSGAYIAARVLTEASEQWFRKRRKIQGQTLQEDARTMQKLIDTRLQNFQSKAQSKSKLKGSMSKEFPSTLASIMVEYSENGLDAHYYWCGDSRGYMLDQEGMHQITVDDIGNPDPWVNLREDAGMNNVVSASHPYTIHTANVHLASPSILITASDGCFGYLRTPMDFEKMILGELMQAKNVKQWKASLDQYLRTAAGDDYTLCVLVIGYGSFEKLQDAYRKRYAFIRQKYETLPPDQEERGRQLWEEYRGEYEKYQRSEV